MRALKLHPEDSELFNNSLDGEKQIFFRNHLPAFKRMWNEEGRTYWLRFLITFKIHFEANLYHQIGSDRLLNFIFIYIHKQFVEGSYSTAKFFIENIFIAARHFHNLPEQSFTKNPFYSKESREAFHALLGKPNLDDEIPVPVMGFACSVYFEFAGSVCAILKKWLQEIDLCEETEKKIDFTLFYWRPCSEWEENNFVVGCFEKYLAIYWKGELPKMLLTCDINNTFSNHNTENCCDYSKEMNVFNLLKDRHGLSSRFCISHVKLLKPTIVYCGTHNNCRLKVLHDDNCSEPYLCEGTPPCIVTCEVSSKKQNQSKELNQANPWKKLIVETFACKEANRRTVSTLAQSDDVLIETYLHEKEGEAKECAENITDDFLCMHDAEIRNAYNQHKRKEQLKKRLRSKLNKKYYFDPKDYEDSEYCWALYEQAQHAWICDMCEGNLKDVVHAKPGNQDLENRNAGSFARVRRALTSVAVGTGDLVIGRVVNPSALLINQSNADCSQSCEKGESKTKSKKSKSKKKKGNSGNLNNKLSDSTCDNMKPISGDSVSECSDMKSDSKNTITNDLKCCDKLGLNTNDSNVSEINTDMKPIDKELKSTTKLTTSAQIANSEVKIKVAPDRIMNSEKNDAKPTSFSESSDASKWETKDSLVTERFFGIDNAIVNSWQNTETINVSQDTNNLDYFKDIDVTESNFVTSLMQDFNDDPKQYEKVDCTDSFPADTKDMVKMMLKTVSSQVEENTIDKFLESGTAEENSLLKVNVTETLIKNEVLQTSNSRIPEVSENNEFSIDAAVENFFSLIGVCKNPSEAHKHDSVKQEFIGVQVKETESIERKVKLKICAFCEKREAQPKSFKRCARCKAEKFVQQRYYCSRSCQLEDWEESHRDEHSKKTEQL